MNTGFGRISVEKQISREQVTWRNSEEIKRLTFLERAIECKGPVSKSCSLRQNKMVLKSDFRKINGLAMNL